jgi:hypothetical protein
VEQLERGWSGLFVRLAGMSRLGSRPGRGQNRGLNGSQGPGRASASGSIVRYLPVVLGVTLVVAVVPVAASVALCALGVICSPWLSMALAGALSFVVSLGGGAYWRSRRGGGELLFSELLLWGWVRRWRQDRKLTRATGLLGLGDSDGAAGGQVLSRAQGERVLAQLGQALEAQDPYVRGHSRRVARHASMTARRMGLPENEVDRVRAAAVVHDVGKLRTPPGILNKPSRLSDA